MYGEKIKTKRREKNLSQEDLARELGITRQAISKWETDKATPTMTNLRELSEVLGVDMAYFIGEADSEKKVDNKEEKDEVEEQKEEKLSKKKAYWQGTLGHLYLCLPLHHRDFLLLSLLLSIYGKTFGERPKSDALPHPNNLHDCGSNILPPSL